jgi:hypothetical protein
MLHGISDIFYYGFHPFICNTLIEMREQIAEFYSIRGTNRLAKEFQPFLDHIFSSF